MTRDFVLPGSRPRYAPDRVVDLEHIRIDLDLDIPARSVRGRCELTARALAPGARRIRLDAAELEIEGVAEDGAPLSYRSDGDTLDIDLGRALTAGERLTLGIDYAASPRRGLYFVGPDEHYPEKPRQVWTQNQDEDARHWFPCIDAPHEKATTEVIATVPAEMFAISNGELVRDETRGDRRTVHWRLDEPHPSYLVTLAAGSFAAVQDRWEDVDLTYYGAPGTEDALRRTAERAPQMLAHFSERFGLRYPYAKYDQIFVADFIFGGMENTTATTLTDAVLLDERAARDHDSDGLLAHELAHQWFGDLLTCRTWSEGWLNEGFATYSEYLWREHIDGRDSADLEVDAWTSQYLEEARSRYQRPVVCNVYDEPLDIFDHHLYRKGARVLHMLRATLGDDAFFRAVSGYLQDHRGGSVETRDLARAVERATGRVTDWFFDQWIHRAGHPELAVSWSWDPDAGRAVLDVEQIQATRRDEPTYRLPAAVSLRAAGERENRSVAIEIAEARQTISFPLAAAPEQAIFDPGRTILAEVKTDKALDLWIGELAGAPLGLDRVQAARALGERGGAQAIRALTRALEGDPFWGVRAAAAEALGETRAPEARDALARALTSARNPRARRGIARALGGFRRDDRAAEALEPIAESGDESYFVEAEACLSLGRIRAARAPEILRRAADRDSFREVIRDGAYRGLAEARDETALSFLLERADYGEPALARRSALRAAAELAAGRRDREAKAARERTEELLFDPDFRVCAAAVEAVRAMADPASLSALRELAEKALDGRLVRRAREVIRDLEDGAAQGERLGRLRDDVDALRAELRSAARRIELLEGRAEPAPEAPAPTRRTGGKKTVARQRAPG